MQKGNSPPTPAPDFETRFEKARSGIGFFLGPILFALILILPPPDAFVHFAQTQIGAAAATGDVLRLVFSLKVTLALLLLMIVWWVTEAVPIPVTSLLPGFILPFFHAYGFQDGKFLELNGRNVLAHYANPVIFLFLAGFLLAGAMQKWGLDRRIALWMLTRGNLSTSPGKILFGMMAATSFLSMWVSNTATTAMMLPIGLGVLSRLNVNSTGSKYAKAVMLGIAYAASIGGVGTIIGTPPNGIAVSILRAENIMQINFLDWMKFGVPFVVIGVPLCWLVLRLVYRFDVTPSDGVRTLLVEEKNGLGKLSRGEKLTLVGFSLAVVLWTTTPFWDLIPGVGNRLEWFDEYLIAVFASFVLFVSPVDWPRRKFVLDWSDSKHIDWGTLLLFGGGIALSDAMFKTGLAKVLASEFVGLFGRPSPVILVLVVVVLMDFLTEVTSNTAVTSMMIPILISISSGLGIEATTLAIPATVAASMAFMLPVATPPNALVYASKQVTVRDMVKAGFVMDIVAALFIVVYFYFYVFLVLGEVKF
jgi:sodium-dependent dicarboxylate transporter 2/3/5